MSPPPAPSDPDDPPGPPAPTAPGAADTYALLTALDLALTDQPADDVTAARFELVVDILIRRGHLTEGHRRLLHNVRPASNGTQLAAGEDKHAIAGPDVDCASLLHLCHGRCCSFKVALSRSDVLEGRLRWVIEEPYVLPRADTGYCTYRDDEARCTVYDDRPTTCRAYDCRGDARVWLDFEQRIPAPLSPHLVPIERLRRPRP